MDRLDELNAFIAVAEAGGFSAAARQSGVSQPTISKAVAGLEKRIGIALLHRSTRKVTVTDQGRRYYDRIKPLLDGMQEAEAEATSSTQAVSGAIRISAPATFGRLHVLPLIPDLLLRNQGLDVDLVLSDAMRGMTEDGIDLAIRLGPTDERDAVIRRVASTPVVCVGSRAYFAARGVPRTPADLTGHNCLLYGAQRDTGTWPLRGPNGHYGVRVRGTLSSNSVETIRAGVLAGVGLGLMTKASLTRELSDPNVMTILDEFVGMVRDVSLVWPKRHFTPVRVRRTTEFFASALSQRLVDACDNGAGYESGTSSMP
jgi:DNA-binding transcriptional LysR family regulator